jgi:hypothetical protein
MSDEAKVKRGEAAWREQREATSRRNAETRKRARTERESRDSVRAARLSAGEEQEAEQVRKLNVQIAREHGGSR